ncbi:MAG: hemolysin family protein [Thermoanaerobaculia bacterium]
MSSDSLMAASLLALVLTVFTVLVQLLAALLDRSGPIRLRYWAEEASGRLLGLFEEPLKFEVFRYLLSWLARMATVGLFLVLLSLTRTLWSPSWLVAMVTLGLILAATELVIRSLVGRDPERALRRFTGIYRVALFFLMPFISALAPLMPAAVVERREDEGEVTEDEIEAFLDVGAREGILDPGEEDLIQRVIDFGDTVVRSVVTPRIDMVCAPVSSSLESLAELFLSSKHSRIPVYQASVDHIVGVLHIRDLLQGLRDEGDTRAEDLAMEPYFVPETKPLNELLSEFQALHLQMAIVVDEYGGTSGMVTVEDLLEEIVGEIEDEHDEAAPVNELLEDGGWRLDGRVPVESLDELFDVELEEEAYETIGGLIFGTLGYVPQPGESLEVGGLRFQIESIDQRRISSVAVHRVVSSDDEVAE